MLLKAVIVTTLLTIPSVSLCAKGTRPPDENPVMGQPLEHRPPNGQNQQPAFPEQTRAAYNPTQTSIQYETVAQGLHHPWSLAFLPDRNFLVTEKPGTLRVVSFDGKIGAPIRGVPAVVYNDDAGLLDIALDPDFTKTRWIYFSYVEPRGNLSGVVVAKAQLTADYSELQNLTKILSVEPSAEINKHYGCRLLFDRDGYLFISLGERFEGANRAAAQAKNSLMGKILRVDRNGKAAPGNPFLGDNSARPEIWSLGHRNPQGLTIHPHTGELWSAEHGPEGGDEINRILPGKNYGWPMIAYGTEYDGSPVNGGRTAQAGMEQPIYYWDPAIAPSGAVFYSGVRIPEWTNNLFVAGLAGEHLARLVFKDDKVIGEERLLLDQHQRMRDIRESPDGLLYVLTDADDGRLIRISPKISGAQL